MKWIEDIQEGQDLSCTCTSCYWNMYRENDERYSDEQSKVCVSESLADFKMKPNSTSCPGYWEK
ncbi:hypothetical protein K2Q31_15780 [Alkalihalobacillus clausii]|nr:hypothetical protein [Shouchella clausii]MBX0320101.1 hypothetical protein [Shouchella clausii]